MPGDWKDLRDAISVAGTTTERDEELARRERCSRRLLNKHDVTPESNEGGPFVDETGSSRHVD